MRNVFIIIFLSLVTAYASAQSIFISQYIETNFGTTPKGIEIYNPTENPIDFSVTNLEIQQGTNGVSCSDLTTINSGILNANEVWVIGTTELTDYATSNGSDLSGTTEYSFLFNGNDALRIYLGGALQDVFGTCGSDPGSNWNGNGVSTENHNLQIKQGICTGTLNFWTDPSIRFDQIANGSTMTGFGDAPNCSDSSDPTSSPTDFFRSKTAGPANWNVAASWESSTDGVDWIDATLYPDDNASGVEIQVGHNIRINSSGVEITNTQVFGTIEVTTNSSFDVSGELDEIELTIENGGEFIVNSNGNFNSTTGNAWGLIKTGGKIIAGPNMGSGTSFVDAYVGYFNGLFYFENDAICEWDNGNTTFGTSSADDDDFFSPYQTGDLAILRILTTPGFSFGSNVEDNVFHAVIEFVDGTEFSLANSGSKTFVGGVRGEGSLIMENSCEQVYIGNDEVIPELGGTAKIIVNLTNDRLNFPNGAEVLADALFTIESNDNSSVAIERIGGNIQINGILDITNLRITNTASGGIFVNNGGTLRTRNTGGLFGSGSAIVNDANFTMETGSTVEYYADVTQAISSGKEYYHLIFSGNGTKNPQSATNVNTNGSIYITGNPTVNYTTHNLGSTDGNSTDFTMDGGSLIIGTGGTQPRPGGSYTITGGEIEFTGNSNTSIRVIPDYYNVRISGRNKQPGAKGFTITNLLNVEPTGQLTIPTSTDTESPYVLNALNGISVESGGELILENNAVLMQNPGISNSGNITQIRKAIVPSNQYNFWASPVSNQDLYTFYPDIPTNRVMVYNTETDFYTIIPNNPSNPPEFQFGIGYSIKGPTSNFPADDNGTTDVTATFIGTPHNESINSTENQIALSNLGQGFNLIGNPFPSNLDLHLFNETAGNSGKILQSTFYFWDNKDNDDFYQQGSEYENQNFAIYNASGFGTGISAPRFGTTGKKPNGIVKPGQGFIVQAAPSATFLEVNNAMRSSTVLRNSEYSPYFKNGISMDSDDEYRRIDQFWIELINPNQLHLQTAVGYFTEAENEFEVYDSEILSESVSDNIYTLSKDDVKLAIQGRKGVFQNHDEIPLGVKIFEHDRYKIQLEETKGIFISYQNIYLKDKSLNIIHNLSDDGPYEFEAPAGVHNDRFEIVFKKDFSSNSVLSAANGNAVKIIKKDGMVHISSSLSKITEVEIFNLSGWSIYKNENVNQQILEIPAISLDKQIIIVTVQTENGEIVSKKLVNN
ncbi:T9SS sorting signal type C domain-containing protein [Moheibacter lacus]|uniref:T9SS sorting signal type C domain-containing protein n=1 Tax=Moheibacter lacus TaxID=2745851 RepID=A0A838ZEU7_9FLAO|nr:T9SS sorting signal type C domain-containing protein [Moheibacter lacus]MBA5628261.1 T9SS sorting signal type C domain-containing protein [Moheibacter lacus]